MQNLRLRFRRRWCIRLEGERDADVELAYREDAAG
jgi:hypothetical protein